MLDCNLDEASSLGGGGIQKIQKGMTGTLSRYIATNIFCSLPHLLLATCSTPPSP